MRVAAGETALTLFFPCETFFSSFFVRCHHRPPRDGPLALRWTNYPRNYDYTFMSLLDYARRMKNCAAEGAREARCEATASFFFFFWVGGVLWILFYKAPPTPPHPTRTLLVGFGQLS